MLDEELYNGQLIFEPLGCEYNAHDDYGYSVISGESRDIESVHSKIKDCIEENKKTGIDVQTFERIKKAKLGGFVRGFDTIELIANSFLNYYFEGNNFFDVYDCIKSITVEDLNRRLKEHFDEEMSVISIVNPMEED